MLIFDQLKKNDPQLRLVAMVVAAGLGILLAGLWWVQVVSAHEYQAHLETQAYRTVRIPAMRGKILDREGRVLAENRPRYNLSLYLDDLRKPFDDAYGQLLKQARAAQKQAIAAQEKKLGRSLTKTELKQFAFTTAQLQQLRAQARLSVANNLVAQVGAAARPAADARRDEIRARLRRRGSRCRSPFCQISTQRKSRGSRNGSPTASARTWICRRRAFIRPARRRRTCSAICAATTVRRKARTRILIIACRIIAAWSASKAGATRNCAGARARNPCWSTTSATAQSENIIDPPEPGHNVVLTIDLDLQRAAEESLARHRGADVRGAVVVMDVNSGDVLAMVSSPSVRPERFCARHLAGQMAENPGFDGGKKPRDV